MDKPVIADNKPAKVTLAKGQEYHFCTCGKSKSQPSCDGSHAGTSFTPKVIVPDKDGVAYLCACKHSANSPYCDGSHTQFKDDQVGLEGPAEKLSPLHKPVATVTKEEPTVEFIHQLSQEGLTSFGHHGPMVAMGGAAISFAPLGPTANYGSSNGEQTIDGRRACFNRAHDRPQCQETTDS